MTISCVSRIVSAAAVALGVITPAAFAQSSKEGEVPRVAGVPIVLRGAPAAEARSAAEPFADDALWYNGQPDRKVAYLSTVNDHVSSVVADDCWLKEGMFYKADYVYVQMAITEGYLPNTQLRIMPDCDGKPDDSMITYIEQFDYTVIDAMPSGELEGFVIYEICYYLDAFIQGEDLAWLAPVHDDVDRDMDPTTVEGGYGFWLSATKGIVQGREAHVDAPAFGLPAWTPASDEICCGACTDMYLRVEGECCWRVLDQDRADLSSTGGLYANTLSQNAPWVRSFDDFQLADPCKEVDAWCVCRIEATVATNCDIETVFAEIYTNDCDAPTVRDAGLLYTLTPTRVIDLHTQVNGLPVYRFVFECPDDVVLLDGRNYWLSVFSEQGFAAGKRHVWLFEEREACNIRLNEARYWNPAIGFDPPTPVSDPDLHGAPRGHAFSVWVCAEGAHLGDPDGGDGQTGDDGDGGDGSDGGDVGDGPDGGTGEPRPTRWPNSYLKDEPFGAGGGSGSGGP
ncbi:MAG: hypothetical protein RIB60_08285 [Phycisphaerales bacterium]